MRRTSRPKREGNVSTDDDKLLGAFARFLELQATLGADHAREQQLSAAEGSRLADDDKATHPIQISQFVSYCLMQAADMAESSRAMLRRDDGTIELPLVALYPLLRAQIESASMAAWVLAPEDRRTRVVRRLQAGHDELTFDTALVKSGLVGKTAAETHDTVRKEATRRKAHRQHLRDVAAANGIFADEYENCRPSWETIVRDAGEALGIEHEKLVFMWRLASGFTHPSMRRGALGLAFSDIETNDGIVRGTLSARSDWMLMILAISHRATHAAVAKWHDSKATP